MFTRNALPAVTILVLGSLLAGCMSVTIGNVWYDGETLHVEAVNPGESRDAGLQVTVWKVSDFRQAELFREYGTIQLDQGTGEYRIPLRLDPGRYKLYLYVSVDGKRTAATIRDLTV